MEDKAIKISFDKDYKIRVFDSEKYSKGEELQQECSAFVESIIYTNFILDKNALHDFFTA